MLLRDTIGGNDVEETFFLELQEKYTLSNMWYIDDFIALGGKRDGVILKRNLKEAKKRAEELVGQTQARIDALKKASNEYMDDALRRTQEAIAQSLSEVEETRNKFNALAAAQAKRNEVSEEN